MNIQKFSIALIVGISGMSHARTRSLSIHSEDSILSGYFSEYSSTSLDSSLNSISGTSSVRSSTEEVVDRVMVMLDAYDLKFIGMEEVSYEEAKQYLINCCYLSPVQADTFLVYVNKALEDGADSDIRKDAIYDMLHRKGSMSLGDWSDQEEYSDDAGSWSIQTDESTGRTYVYFEKIDHCFPLEKGLYFYLSQNYLDGVNIKSSHMQIRFDLTLDPRNGQVYDQSGQAYSDKFQGIYLPEQIFKRNKIKRRHSI